jgi:hypothetical protein
VVASISVIWSWKQTTDFLSCLVSELQNQYSAGLKLTTFFRSSDLSIFSSWSQKINIPSLVQIGLPVLEQTRAHNFSFMCKLSAIFGQYTGVSRRKDVPASQCGPPVGWHLDG